MKNEKKDKCSEFPIMVDTTFGW